VARAVEEVIALAAENGVGWVGTRNANHAGAAAVYARDAGWSHLVIPITPGQESAIDDWARIRDAFR
jgi:LDH2 family malate/lactate/ureidoglycolate dehydrogenase